MDWKNQCVAVIPCFDEAGRVGATVAGALLQVASVIVVDDGSGDGTAAEAAGAGARVVRHDCNRGKGAAVRTGLVEALRGGYSWAVLLDGDGQHRPEDIPSLFACAGSTGADLVVGDRSGGFGGMSWLRRWVNRCMSWEISRVTGQALRDTQCGLRLIRLEAWRQVPLESEHFEIESEMVVGFVRGGYRVRFAPIQTVPQRRASRIHPVVDTVRWLRWRLALESRPERGRACPQT